MTEKLPIVDALRKINHMSVEDCFLQSPMYAKAADAIEALALALEIVTQKGPTGARIIPTFEERIFIARGALDKVRRFV